MNRQQRKTDGGTARDRITSSKAFILVTLKGDSMDILYDTTSCNEKEHLSDSLMKRLARATMECVAKARSEIITAKAQSDQADKVQAAKDKRSQELAAA